MVFEAPKMFYPERYLCIYVAMGGGGQPNVYLKQYMYFSGKFSQPQKFRLHSNRPLLAFVNGIPLAIHILGLLHVRKSILLISATS